MPLRSKCGGCGQAFTAPDTLAGKTVKCPKCGAKIDIAPVAIRAAAVAPQLESLPKLESGLDSALQDAAVMETATASSEQRGAGRSAPLGFAPATKLAANRSTKRLGNLASLPGRQFFKRHMAVSLLTMLAIGFVFVFLGREQPFLAAGFAFVGVLGILACLSLGPLAMLTEFCAEQRPTFASGFVLTSIAGKGSGAILKQLGYEPPKSWLHPVSFFFIAIGIVFLLCVIGLLLSFLTVHRKRVADSVKGLAVGLYGLLGAVFMLSGNPDAGQDLAARLAVREGQAAAPEFSHPNSPPAQQPSPASPSPRSVKSSPTPEQPVASAAESPPPAKSEEPVASTPATHIAARTSMEEAKKSAAERLAEMKANEARVYNRSKLPKADSAKRFVQLAKFDYLLGGDDDAMRRMRQIRANKQLKLMMRWGVGLSLSGKGSKEQPVVTRAWDLRKLTGPIGEAIAKGLRDRTDSDRFGDWSAHEAFFYKDPEFAGGPKQDLIENARKVGLDGLVVLVVDAKGPKSSTIVAHVVDLVGEVESWESPKLTSKDANQATANLFSQNVLEHIDKNFVLDPSEPPDAQTAQARVAELIRLHGEDASRIQPLETLCELRYYLAHKLLAPEEFVQACDTLCGAGLGAKIMDGPWASAVAALEQLNAPGGE